jgi:hypothetical protein
MRLAPVITCTHVSPVHSLYTHPDVTWTRARSEADGGLEAAKEVKRKEEAARRKQYEDEEKEQRAKDAAQKARKEAAEAADKALQSATIGEPLTCAGCRTSVDCKAVPPWRPSSDDHRGTCKLGLLGLLGLFRSDVDEATHRVVARAPGSGLQGPVL